MRVHLLAFCTLSIGAMVLACGGRGSNFEEDGGADGGLADGANADTSCTFCGSDSGKGDGGPTSTCSPDLHEILDLNGDVLTTCPPDQGCLGGACVPACAAAAGAKGSVGCDFMIAT